MFTAVRVHAGSESALRVSDTLDDNGTVRVSLGPPPGGADGGRSGATGDGVLVDRVYGADATDETVWKDLGEGHVSRLQQ